ncbi:MAG: hypothetical protein ACXWAT_00465 [Methylobacter sp.]
MNNRLAIFFMAGWYDASERRIKHREGIKKALNSERKTKTVKMRLLHHRDSQLVVIE